VGVPRFQTPPHSTPTPRGRRLRRHAAKQQQPHPVRFPFGPSCCCRCCSRPPPPPPRRGRPWMEIARSAAAVGCSKEQQRIYADWFALADPGASARPRPHPTPAIGRFEGWEARCLCFAASPVADSLDFPCRWRRPRHGRRRHQVLRHVRPLSRRPQAGESPAPPRRRPELPLPLVNAV
jgi:hypothetical protein